MTTLTLELPVTDLMVAPTQPATPPLSMPASWLPAAVAALHAFRHQP